MKQRWLVLCLLCLTGCNLSIDPTPSLPVPAVAETLTDLSAEFISEATPAQNNSSTEAQTPRATNRPSVTLTPTIPCATAVGWDEYSIKRGDSVSTIASRANTTIEILIQANCLANPNNLLVGQVLVLPPPIMTATP